MNSQVKYLIITGANGSIGSFLSKNLLSDFEQIVCLDLSFGEKSQDNQNNKLIHISTDLREGFPSSVLDFIEKHSREGIALINAIGDISSATVVKLNHSKTLHKSSTKELSKKINKSYLINFEFPIIASIEFANLILSERGFGCIVNFSSVSSYGNIGQLSYSSMKAGLEVASKVIAEEFGPFGIRCNCIAPGFINTPSMIEAVSEERRKFLKKMIPVRSFGELKDLIPAIKSLLFSNYINGHTLRVDGGYKL